MIDKCNLLVSKFKLDHIAQEKNLTLELNLNWSLSMTELFNEQWQANTGTTNKNTCTFCWLVSDILNTVSLSVSD